MVIELKSKPAIRIDQEISTFIDGTQQRLDRLLAQYLAPDKPLGDKRERGQRWGDGFEVMARGCYGTKMRGSTLQLHVGFEDGKPAARFMINHEPHPIEHAFEEAADLPKFTEWINTSIAHIEEELAEFEKRVLEAPPRPVVADSYQKTDEPVEAAPKTESPEEKLAKVVQNGATRGLFAGARLGWELSSRRPISSRIFAMLSLAWSGAKLSSMRGSLGGAFAKVSADLDFRDEMTAKHERGEPLRRSEQRRLQTQVEEEVEIVRKNGEALRIPEHRSSLNTLAHLRMLLGQPMPEADVLAGRQRVMEQYIEHAHTVVHDVMAKEDMDRVGEAIRVMRDVSTYVQRAREEQVPLTAKNLKMAAEVTECDFQIKRINNDRLRRDKPEQQAEFDRIGQKLEYQLGDSHPFTLNEKLDRISEEELSPRAKQAFRGRAWLNEIKKMLHELSHTLSQNNPFRANHARTTLDNIRGLLKWKEENQVELRPEAMMRIQRGLDSLEKGAGMVRRLEQERDELTRQL